MALQVNFTASQASNCKDIDVIDTTGVYDALNNPTGWGAPNADTTDVTQATLYIVTPSGSSYAIDATLLLNDELTVLGSSIGYTGKLPDGYYDIRYEVQGVFGGNSGVLSSERKNVLFYGNVYCCIEKMNVDDACVCDTSEVEEMMLLLEAMKAADECCDIVCAKKILTELTRRCAKKCNC